MKVITQLVQHFWQRGGLTTTEVDYLVRHGFVRERDLPGYVPPPPDAVVERPTWHPIEPLPETALEGVEEALVRRKPHRARQGEAKGDVLEIEDLCERLRDDFQRRAQHLPVIVALGRRLACGNDWQGALSGLRHADA